MIKYHFHLKKSSKGITLIRDLFLAFLILFCANLIKSIVVVLFNVSFELRAYNGEIGNFLLKGGNYLNVLVFTVLLEELAFRLLLVPNKRNIFISLIVLSTLVLDWLLIISGINEEAYFLIIIFSLVIICIVLHFIIPTTIMFAVANKNIYFTLSVVGFTFFHLFSYCFSWGLLFWTPVFFLPQLVGGIILGYLRLKYGIVWSIIFHSIYNGMILFAGTAFS